MPYHATTRLLKVLRDTPETALINEAAAIIRRGGLVAFPTETVYGLGANGLDADAVARIFQAKERPANDPVILHLSTMAQLNEVTNDVPPIAERLAEVFWPGPLTLVLNRAAHVPDNVTAGQPTVAVRMPNHPVALALIRAADVPIAAPSANRFSRPSPTTAAHVMADLQGRVDIILDGGPTDIGVESTIIDVTGPVPVVLRPGGVALEQLRQYAPTLAFRPIYLPETTDAAPAPGTLLKHYSPRARVMVFRGQRAACLQAMRREAERISLSGGTAAIMALDDDAAQLRDTPSQIALLGSNITSMAANLFNAMRALDSTGASAILVRAPVPDGLGLAVWDRLLRAAEGHVINVDPEDG